METNDSSGNREHGLDEDAARILVRQFSDWVNNMGHKNKHFAHAVMQEHRTLQQQMFGTMLACMDACAKSEHHDLRNEFTVLKCREIMRLFPDGTQVPLI